MTEYIIQGFATGLGLITAIGAQNVFVLSQGVRRNHMLLTAGVCSACDAMLIGIGVAGVGGVVAGSPVLRVAAAWGGALFLAWYGFHSLKAAWQGGEGLHADDEGMRSRRKVLSFTLAVSLLNPHVYVDTILLLGGLSAGFPGNGRWGFGLGAASASVVWFFALSFGGRVLAPILGRPGPWRVLQGAVGCFMFVVAAGLILRS